MGSDDCRKTSSLSSSTYPCPVLRTLVSVSCAEVDAVEWSFCLFRLWVFSSWLFFVHIFLFAFALLPIDQAPFGWGFYVPLCACNNQKQTQHDESSCRRGDRCMIEVHSVFVTLAAWFCVLQNEMYDNIYLNLCVCVCVCVVVGVTVVGNPLSGPVHDLRERFGAIFMLNVFHSMTNEASSPGAVLVMRRARLACDRRGLSNTAIRRVAKVAKMDEVYSARKIGGVPHLSALFKAVTSVLPSAMNQCTRITRRWFRTTPKSHNQVCVPLVVRLMIVLNVVGVVFPPFFSLFFLSLFSFFKHILYIYITRQCGSGDTLRLLCWEKKYIGKLRYRK